MARPPLSDSPGGDAPRRRADARRNIEGILAAAGKVFADNPRASMQDIAEAAGVHRATVHRHFPARDDLLRALRARALDATIAIFEDPEIMSGDPDLALRRLTRRMLELGDTTRLWRLTPFVDDASDERKELLGRPLIALFERGRDAGVMRADIEPSALAFAWGALLLSVLPPIAAGESTFDEATDLVCRLITRQA